jgi:hypothetical protein
MWNRQNESEEDRIHCSVFGILVAKVPLEAETNQPWMVMVMVVLFCSVCFFANAK